jgi:hypothetical protein
LSNIIDLASRRTHKEVREWIGRRRVPVTPIDRLVALKVSLANIEKMIKELKEETNG